MNQGKLVITAMVAIGLGMAVFAWWARYSASQRVLDRFGPTVAVAVRNGEKVELLRLSPVADDSLDQEVIRGPYNRGKGDNYVVETQDITEAAGLIHARHHLLHEKGFEWDLSAKPLSEDNEMRPSWGVALRFIHGTDAATWLLDFKRQRAFIVERDTEIGMAPIAPSLQTFINQLPQPTIVSP